MMKSRENLLEGYFLQNMPVNRRMTVNISKRPTSIKKAANHLPASGMDAHVNAGPVAPNAGPVLPNAEMVEPNAVSNDSPKHCIKKHPKTMSIINQLMEIFIVKMGRYWCNMQ